MIKRSGVPSSDRSPTSLLGRDRELTRLSTLVQRMRDGHSGALVLSGEAGAGKTALLDRIADTAGPTVRVERMVASESEVELPYAGLQLMCSRLMTERSSPPCPAARCAPGGLRAARRGFAEPAAGRAGGVGLAHPGRERGPLLCIVDDAQWFDGVSALAITSVIRRLDDERIAVILAMRQVDERFADLPQLTVGGLGDEDARQLLRRNLPSAIDPRVVDQLIAESHGNPLALRELPGSLSPTQLAGGFALASLMPLESRIERSLLSRLESLAPSTRMLLLLAAADPTGDPGLLWRASTALGLGPEDFEAAQQADALIVGARVSFRHPLIRSAVYQAASPQDRRNVHAALAVATSVDQDPDRRAWHRASATIQPDEEVAADLEQSASRARTRGGVAATAAFLERAAELSPSPTRRVERLIASAEAKHEAGAPEMALRLLDSIRDQPLTAFQEASIGRMRARANYALRRDRSAPRQLFDRRPKLGASRPGPGPRHLHGGPVCGRLRRPAR